MANTPAALCICGHGITDHTDGSGRCIEVTGRCQCEGVIELCSVCQHSSESHNGPSGQCVRIVRKTEMPCGCTNYPAEQTEGS